MTAPLLEVNDLKKHFFVHSGFFGAGAATVYAVDGISFTIEMEVVPLTTRLGRTQTYYALG